MDTDQEARSLLAPLKEHATPASNLDIGGAVIKGQRRLRTRRWTTPAAVAVVFLSLVPISLALQDRPTSAPPVAADPEIHSPTPSPPQPLPPPPFPVSCTARLLPGPGAATVTYVERGDPSGRFLAGFLEDPQGNRRPLLWADGVLHAINAPGQETMSIVVNRHGTVAGSSMETRQGASDIFNWIYRDGRLELITEVGRGAIEYRQVIDINSRGDILLDSRMRKGPEGTPRQGPAIWSGGRLRELPRPTGLTEVSANSLDEDGTVVGRHHSEQARYVSEHSLVWTPEGEVQLFKVPEGYGPTGSLRHVRNGWVVGSFRQPNSSASDPAEMVGNLRTGSFERAGLTMAFGLNRHGWIAGFESGPERTQVPAIAGDGKVLKLPMPPGGQPADEMSASSISDDGRVIGGAVSLGGGNHAATIWTCQP